MRSSGLTRLPAWKPFTRGLRAACAKDPASDAKQILHPKQPISNQQKPLYGSRKSSASHEAVIQSQSSCQR